MRKLNRKKENYRTIKLLIIITVLFVCMGVGYSYLAQSVNINATVNILPTMEYEQNKWNIGSRTVYQINNFAITNRQTVSSYGWQLIFNVPEDTRVVSCRSVSCEVVDSQLIVTSVPENAIIGSGETINVFFQFSTAESDYVLDLESLYIFTVENPNPSEITLIEGIDTSFTKIGPWGWGSYNTQYSVTIRNNTDIDLMYWEAHFNISTDDITITNNWNCEYVIKDNELVVTGVNYNLAINSGDYITFGIMINTRSRNFSLTKNYTIGKGIRN